MQDSTGGALGEATSADVEPTGKGGQQRVVATLADGSTNRGKLNGPALEWEDGSVWRRTPLQQAVLGEWVDPADERYIVRVDVTPETVMEGHQKHSADSSKVKDMVAGLIDEIATQRRLANHSLHQLFELRPERGLSFFFGACRRRTPRATADPEG